MGVHKLNHIGVAAKNADKTADFFQKYLGARIISRDLIPDQQMISEQIMVGNQVLEVMETVAPDGVIGKFISKRGEGIHHISLGVSELEKLIEIMEADGIQIIGKQLDQKNKVAFISPRSTGGILIELCEESE